MGTGQAWGQSIFLGIDFADRAENTDRDDFNAPFFPLTCCGAAMVRLARRETIDPHEVVVAHICNRTVRKCFLMGEDASSGKSFDHRKIWIEQYLQQFSKQFGVDLLGFSILSNHMHLILRTRPDVVATWSDADTARPPSHVPSPPGAGVDDGLADDLKIKLVRWRPLLACFGLRRSFEVWRLAHSARP